ncbi:MAG: polyprenyl synthetase family protein [Phycisphaerales bacterium JB039]
MRGVIDIPAELAPVGEDLAAFLDRVAGRFDDHLASELPPVRDLCHHLRGYRGKMLRPALTLLAAMTAAGRPAAELLQGDRGEDLVRIAAVCELIHMATLVHDDVLDDADIRRRTRTINRLRGNETAIILGDYLIASAYHLCSTLQDQAVALLVAATSRTLCEGELLQLHHREDWSLDEPTYFEIIDRKTAALISAACRLGARAAGAGAGAEGRLAEGGRLLGIAFQIPDDLLDLTGAEGVVGKSLGKDPQKGKCTLPVILWLAEAQPIERGQRLGRLRQVTDPAAGPASALAEALDRAGALDRARQRASDLVERARALLAASPPSPARQLMDLMARAIVERAM